MTIGVTKQMNDLIAQAHDANGPKESAVVFIRGVRQQIIDAGVDPIALRALADSLYTGEGAAAAAISMAEVPVVERTGNPPYPVTSTLNPLYPAATANPVYP